MTAHSSPCPSCGDTAGASVREMSLMSVAASRKVERERYSPSPSRVSRILLLPAGPVLMVVAPFSVQCEQIRTNVLRVANTTIRSYCQPDNRTNNGVGSCAVSIRTADMGGTSPISPSCVGRFRQVRQGRDDADGRRLTVMTWPIRRTMYSGSSGRLGSLVMPLRASVLIRYWSITQSSAERLPRR